jgi:N-methylhydantoinase A
MASSVKMTTVGGGHEPRDFAMIAYGGAGPLHGAEIARELGIRTVIVPNHPGHFCAYGMLCADLKYDVVQTMAIGLEQLDLADAEKQFVSLEDRGRASLKEIKVHLAIVSVSRFADMRYRGQEHTLKIRLPENVAHLPEQYAQRFQSRIPSTSAIPVRMFRSIWSIFRLSCRHGR